MTFRIVFILLISLGVVLGSCVNKDRENFMEKWNAFETQLIRKNKSFQPFKTFDSIRGDIHLVEFKSDSLVLKGLLNTKNIDSTSRKPVLVFLHGGFALSYSQLDALKPFTEAGYIIFAPTYRGENGNPGFFELFLGEVKDAKAAIHWISRQPYTDPEKIFVFGWSVGGGISLNLTFHDDLPVRISGSSAGIYDRDLINSWATEDDMILFPYDHRSEKENYFRLPVYSLENMVRPHFAYIGEEDGYASVKNLMDSLYPRETTKLKLIKVRGDHSSSLKTAIRKFLTEIEREPGSKDIIEAANK